MKIIRIRQPTLDEEIKVDNTARARENENGTGLGLFLCKEFVEKHGGMIRAKSQNGRGRIFIINLPSG